MARPSGGAPRGGLVIKEYTKASKAKGNDIRQNLVERVNPFGVLDRPGATQKVS